MTGRPSLTFSRTRAAAARAEEEDESSLCTAMSYRRRFPRLGSQFQAKVPKKTNDKPYETQRPNPVHMSSDLPHMTAEDASVWLREKGAQELKGPLKEVNQCPLSSSKSATPTNIPFSTSLGRFYDDHLHPSGVDNLRVENSFTTSTKSNDNQNTNSHKQWVAALHEWHEAHEKAQTAASSTRNRRSRIKRPLEAPSPEELLPIPKVRALLDHHQNDDPTQQSVAQTKWSLLVSVEAGQACKRIRELKRKSVNNISQQEDSADTSKRWRMLCQTSGTNVRGNYRTTRYPSSLLCSQQLSTKHETITSLRNSWKAVLACAISYQQHISTGPPLKLSTIVALLENSNQLMAPEQAWPCYEPLVGEINTALNSFVDGIEKARKIRAQWMDLWYQKGVELDVVRKALKQVETLSIWPDEYDELNRQVQEIAEWQKRVESIKNSPSQNDLKELEELFHEAEKCHGFRSKGFQELKCKLQKAYELRDRVLEWKKGMSDEEKSDFTSVPSENLKSVTSMVREISRLKLKFPEASFVQNLSEIAEAWVERAQIAIRSRISLTEIKSLIRRGQEIPMDLNEHLEKLKARDKKAQEWLDRLGEFVDVSDPENMASAQWLNEVRNKIDEGGNTVNLLHDLTCEGNRIPVEMDCVKSLQIELDARNWSVRARSWLPSDSGDDMCKKGKLEDIREHMEKAQLLRNRLALTPEEKAAWVLDGEQELKHVLQQVDNWFEEYQKLVESDSRRGSRPEVSISVLRECVDKVNAINVNLGPSSLKVSKILSQAEKWYSKYGALYERCLRENCGEKVSLDSLKEAVQDADSGIGVLDLKEANELHELLKRTELWFESANVAISGKKLRGKQKMVFKVGDLKDLVTKGRCLPVDTTTNVAKLEDTVRSMNERKDRVAKEIAVISIEFQQLKNAITRKHGQPEKFAPSFDDGEPADLFENNGTLEKKQQESNCPSVCVDDIVKINMTRDKIELSESAEGLIKNLCQDSKSSCLVSAEGEIVLHLEDVSRWISRSLKYVENPRDIFDGRFYGAFDRFLREGASLLEAAVVEDGGPIHDASLRWKDLVKDQIERMNVLKRKRDEFVDWCERAEELLPGSEKKLSLDKLRELQRQSLRFPPDCDAVVRVQELAHRCENWVVAAKNALEDEEKLLLHEAKGILEEGNRLGVVCDELRILRNGVKAARTWANKAKKCKPEQIQTQMKMVKSLLDEYEKLIVSLPEEYNRLSYGLKNYCICRRPYEGFMVKCEKCDDWFHGACIGISQSKAEKKLEKYVCVRCLVAKVFETSNSTIVSVLRKWTSEEELKKARMTNAQKHQRKIRKETKDVEKLQAEIDQINKAVSERKTGHVACHHHESLSIAGENSINQMQAKDSVDPSTATNTQLSSLLYEAESEESLRLKLCGLTTAINQCKAKLQDLSESAIRRRNEEEIENVKAKMIKKWCIRVRSLVVAPATHERAQSSRPLVNGDLSPPMELVLQEASKHGLTRYTDVCTVLNALKCLCWSSQTMHILARRPRACDAVASVRQASSLKLPDEKGLRMIKSMAQRATQWNFKASRLLAPVPGEKRPYDMKELRSLADVADDIPLRMPFEPRVLAVIEDKGSRHCVCGGPSDGRLMLSCDRCESWFHAYCVGIKPEDSDIIGEWMCPPCQGDPGNYSEDKLRGFHEAFGREEVDPLDIDDDDSSCSKAPRIEKLWPPYGLLGSEKCVSSLGEHLCALPDDVGEWDAMTADSIPHGSHVVTTENSCKAISLPNHLEDKVPNEISVDGTTRSDCGKSGFSSHGSEHSKDDADSSLSGTDWLALNGQKQRAGHMCRAAPNLSFGRQLPYLAGRTQAEPHDIEDIFRDSSAVGRQNDQIVMANDDDKLLDPVAQLLAMKDVMVASVKDS